MRLMTLSETATGGPPPMAVLAHELRSPLAAMVGLADAMASEVLGPLPPAYAEYVRLIHGAGVHALTVLAALSEAIPAVAEPLEAAGQVAREVIRTFQAGRAGADLRLALEDGASAAMAPGRALRQVLFNLLGNASKFAAAGGPIDVTLRREGERLVLEVGDSGPGASAAAAGVTPAGSGLGLDIVRALCAAHGGGFSLETSPSGSTARAWLTAPATP
jgi:cell cycle sensor histidine kinase DivJ